MTQSVTDKTPMRLDTWRGHTDPPLMWIVVATASVALHLLLFWLMRSQYSRLPLQQHSNAVAIEFIETSPSSTSKVRAKLPTTPSPNQPSTTPAREQQVTQKNSTPIPEPTNENSSAIAFVHKKAKSSLPRDHQLPKKIIVEQKRISTKSKLIITPVLTPSPKIPHHQNLVVRHLLKIHHNPQVATQSPKAPQKTNIHTSVQPTPVADEPQKLPPDTKEPINTTNSTDTAIKTPPQEPPVSENQGVAIAQAPTNQVGEIPRIAPSPKKETLPNQSIKRRQEPRRTETFHAQPEENPTSPSVNKNTSLTTSPSTGGGGFVATWNVESGLRHDIQDIPAKPIVSSSEKELNLSSTNRELNSQPVEFQVSLVINKTGNLEMIIVDPKIPEPQASQYQKYAQEIFQGQQFTPASSNGGEPKKSNLLVRIKIQPKSP